ncbi:MAG: hypothetical protein VXZ72_02355 [Chlamydiota bacterium]|nr:hypothetical protein [Chlamydiota bacterium]
MFYDTLASAKEEMSKLSKLSPYAKTYLVGAAGLGGLGAAGGALFQTKASLRGDQFDKLSPKEQRARIKRQRLIGAAGGAARGLAANHMLLNTILPTKSRAKDLANIYGGAGLMALGGGIADYKRLDEAALRANHKRMHGESRPAYDRRIKQMRIGRAASDALGAIGLGIAAGQGRDEISNTLRLDPNVASSGSVRDFFNDFVSGRKAYSSGRRYSYSGGSSSGGSSSGGSYTPPDPDFISNPSYGYTADIDGTAKAGRDFAGFASGMGDLGSELRKVQGDKAAAAALRKKLKKAYRKAVVAAHPDKGGDPEKFKHLSQAFENIDHFLEKNSAWLDAYRRTSFYEKIASASRRRRG